MKLRLPLLVLVALACGEGPDDLFVIAGTTTTRAGDALPGVPVTATRQFGGGCGAGKQLQATQSGDGGAFSFDFIRVEVQSFSNLSTCLRLQADFESGATVWSDLYLLPNRLTLPPLNDWSAGLSFDETPDGGVPRFTPVVSPDAGVKSCAGSFPEAEEVAHGIVARTRDGGIAWEQTDRATRYRIDDAGTALGQISEPAPFVIPYEAFEDFALDVSLEAKRTGCVEVAQRPGLGNIFQVLTRWKSPGAVARKGTLLPVSRGASCDGWGLPCPLTDGDVTGVDLELPTNKFRIRLARSAKIRSIVVRGALIDTSLLAGERVSVRVGTESDTVTLLSLPDPLEQYVFFNDTMGAQRAFRFIELSEPLGPGSTVELEFDRIFYRVGEISLFE